MPATIIGIATALPPHRIRQDDAAAIARRFSCETAEHDRVFTAIFRLAGVEERGSVLLEASAGDLASRQGFYGESSPTTSRRMECYEAAAAPLAEDSARRALAAARLDPARITHVVTVSCSGFLAPGVDQALMRRLGLGAEVERTHVGFMGCHGLLNGLRVARAFVESDNSARVLLCAVELCSLHFQYGWDTERMVANALFADGAAAMVIAPSAVGFGPGGREDLAIRAVGSSVFPGSEDAMTWRVGDHGFVMTLSQRVPELIGRNLRPWISTWLARSGLTVESVGSWAVHPGGPRILSVVGESLALERSALSASFGVLADHGNMSSATIAFVLERLHAADAPRPWVAMAFGPGLAIEVALLG